MSVQREYPIRCPDCGSEFRAPLYEAITVDEGSEERDALLHNRVNQVRCEECGKEFRVDKPLLVHDPKIRRLIYWSPGDRPENAERQAMQLLTAYASAASDDAPAPRMTVVLERNELVEKLFVFDAGLDDRAVEYLKYIVASRNPERVRPAEQDVLFNGVDSDGDQLSFIVQNRASREIELAFQYRMDVYREVEALFGPAVSADGGNADDADRPATTLQRLLPGPYVSYRSLVGRDDVPQLFQSDPAR